MTLDDGTQELDRLFKQIEESPWRERDQAQRVVSETTGESANEQGYADIRESLYGLSDSGHGLKNGLFDSGPSEDETLTIDVDDNDLPEWDFVEVQGTWSVIWTEDANAPMGYSLVCTQASASASDQFYLEQTIPIDFYRRLVTTVRSSADNANMQLDIAVAFLDEAGSEVGSTQTGAYTGTAETTDRLWREPPALAVEARIRFGVTNIAGTAGQTRTILFISVNEPQVYSVNITGIKSFLSPAISTDYAMPYPSDIIPNGVYKADTDGFVLGISAKTDDTISAGNIVARVENDTAATTPGPTVTLLNGTLAANATASLDGATSFDFAAGDELHLELSADGSYASTGGADYWGTARLFLVVNDEGDW